MTPNRWEHDRMVRLAEMVVEAAGPEVEVACDLHTRLDKHSAIRLARDLEHLKLMWLEEPIPPENVDTMREITAATSTPICAGENLYLRHGFRDLIEKHAVDIIMPDIPKCGGLSECRKIANMAEIYSMPFAPHNVSSPIGTMASAHVCATIPNFLILEFHWTDARLLVDDHQREARHHRGRLHRDRRRPRHRRRTRRGGREGAPVSRHDMVSMRPDRPG